MSRKYKFRNPDGIYFVTYSVVRWIDVFTRNIYRNILLDSFIYCQRKKGLKIHAYVIMTNHVHIIISAEEGFVENPEDYIFTSARDYSGIKGLIDIEIIE